MDLERQHVLGAEDRDVSAAALVQAEGAQLPPAGDRSCWSPQDSSKAGLQCWFSIQAMAKVHPP